MDIDNQSDATLDASPSLEDFTAVVGRVETSDIVYISVRGNTKGESTEGVKAYIDWNQNGIFDDATESYLIGYLKNSTGTDGKQVTAAIRVPSSAKIGDTRMRVIKAFDLMANPWSCNEGNAIWGQAEDYTLRVYGLESEMIVCSSFEDGEDGSCATPPSPAGVVYSGPLNLTIPPTAEGLKINFVTGETSPLDVPFPHFSANKGDPYLYGPGLLFSWGTDTNNAGVVLTDTGPYQVLGSGDTIGPSSTFFSYYGESREVKFWSGVNGYLGVRFMNEESGEVNYGYVHMLTTAESGFPAMILDYAYDDSGAEITIP